MNATELAKLSDEEDNITTIHIYMETCTHMCVLGKGITAIECNSFLCRIINRLAFLCTPPERELVCLPPKDI